MLGHNGGPPVEDYADRDGFVVISRAIRSHPIVGFGLRGVYSPAEAWIDLIMECRYAEGRVVNAGTVMTISPGQLLGAVSWLAARWGWTPKQVRVFLDKLEADGMISKGYKNCDESEKSEQVQYGKNQGQQDGNQDGKHKGKQAHFITICNYEIYQFVQRKKGQTEGQTNGQTEGQIKGKQGANKGQYNKEEQGNKGIINNPPFPPLGGEARETRAAVNRQAAQDAFAKWQGFAKSIGLPCPRDSTFDVFGKKLAARLYEHAAEPKGYVEMMAVFDLAIDNIRRSKFLRGQTTDFRADLKFLCQRESFAKIISGGYGNGSAAHSDGDNSENARQLALVRQQLELARREDGLD